MACNFRSVKAAKENCTENPSGTGTRIYFVPAAQFEAEGKKLPTVSDASAIFDAESFAPTNCTEVYEFPCVPNTGKVDGNSNGTGKAFTCTVTCRVEAEPEVMSHNARTMNNMRQYYILVETGTVVTEEGQTKKEYYVVGSQSRAMTLEDAFTSGDAVDSENGHTLTITCPYMVYPRTTWTGNLAAPLDSTPLQS